MWTWMSSEQGNERPSMAIVSLVTFIWSESSPIAITAPNTANFIIGCPIGDFHFPFFFSKRRGHFPDAMAPVGYYKSALLRPRFI